MTSILLPYRRSGGKDSCFNMMECVKHGHTIVALVNIYPEEEGKDELDSYMYQTVGHEGIHLYAEAMALPLFRAQTKGCATTQEMEYSVGLEGETEQHDEVEDLYKLLKRVKVNFAQIICDPTTYRCLPVHAYTTPGRMSD